MSKKQMSNEMVSRFGFENKKVIRFFQAMDKGATREQLEALYNKAMARYNK